MTVDKMQEKMDERKTELAAMSRSELEIALSDMGAEVYHTPKRTIVHMRFFPADEELWQRLCSMPEGKAAYVRRLIREDMERSSEHRIEVP